MVSELGKQLDKAEYQALALNGCQIPVIHVVGSHLSELDGACNPHYSVSPHLEIHLAPQMYPTWPEQHLLLPKSCTNSNYLPPEAFFPAQIFGVNFFFLGLILRSTYWHQVSDHYSGTPLQELFFFFPLIHFAEIGFLFLEETHDKNMLCSS